MRAPLPARVLPLLAALIRRPRLVPETSPALGLHRAAQRARERQPRVARTLRPLHVTQTTIVHGQPAPRVPERQPRVARSPIQLIVPAITIAPGAPRVPSARAHQRSAVS